jgi:hypothetical protein
MAFTGELEQLHIVDIIQLLNTTRKSGTFSVRGKKGESRIIFSKGYIVGASHLNNKVRIGTVLVKMKAISVEDLTQALDAQKNAGKNRKPLVNTLIKLGKIDRETAAKGLKKLIEITLVELIGWNTGTFTLHSDVVSVSPECSYPLSEMEQEISIDAQMLLMDALRIYDEKERDREAGKTATSDEDLFGDVVPAERRLEQAAAEPVITADDLGLGDLDRLERKMPEFVPEDEIFNPAEIHRQKIKETLAGFPAEGQEAFVSFLESSATSRGSAEGRQRKDNRTKAIVVFSEDELIKHSVMTICKAEDVLVFAPDGEEEFVGIIDQCLKIKVLPVLVFDDPGRSEKIVSRDRIFGLRRRARELYPELVVIQTASSLDYDVMLQAYREGVRAVLPRPSQEKDREAFIGDAIAFLGVFRSYVTTVFGQQKAPAASEEGLSRLKESVRALRDRNETAPSQVLLQYIAGVCERAITFIVRPSELSGEKAIGVFAEKDQGPTSVTRLKVPLAEPSVFRDAVERGAFYYGESDDDMLKKHIFDAIGAPLDPVIILLPVKSRGKVMMLAYGDFGMQGASPVPVDLLEIMASQAGLAMENALYHRQITKGSRK